MSQPAPTRCLVMVPNFVSSESEEVEVRQCHRAMPEGHVMCDEHWAEVSSGPRRLVFQAQREAQKQGRRRHGEKWRVAVREALRELFRTHCSKIAELRTKEREECTRTR